MWAALLTALRNRLLVTAGEVFADKTVAVEVGASAQVPTAPTVVLIRGPATPRAEFAETGQGEQIIYIECWAYDHGTESGNDALETIETWVADELVRKLVRLLPDTDAIASLQAVEPDNDAFRPSVGSRMTLRLRLRRATSPT